MIQKIIDKLISQHKDEEKRGKSTFYKLNVVTSAKDEKSAKKELETQKQKITDKES